MTVKKIGFLFLLLTFAAAAFSDQTTDAYAKLFAPETSEKEIEQMFADSFLAAVPVAKIREILQIYTSSLGKYNSIDTQKEPFELSFAEGKTKTTIGFDQAGKINTLWFGAPEIVGDSLEKVIDLFRKIDGKVSVCLMKNNVDLLLDLNSAEPLGVGSTFKLYILKALEQQVKAGKFKWNDLVKIEEKAKSFPSGILHDWPVGTSLTLESMAALMISLSDNTATDHLFNLVGRDEMTRLLPRSYNPAFNTLELFKLKIFFPEIGKKFAEADMNDKLQILADLAKKELEFESSLDKLKKWEKPVMIDKLEWFISARDLCDTIFHLKDNSLIKINPAYGIVDKKDWETVGFKGGSEPGVINYTWVLQHKGEKDFYCLSCTLNNSLEAEKTSDFDVAVSRLIKLLQQKKVEVH